MDLFDTGLEAQIEREQPLAARLRPRVIEEFIGQDHILGPGRLLRRAIQADRLSSLIFYGPPGTGKTTLAAVIANTTRSYFISINAVLAGVAEIRSGIENAQERRKLHSQRTILFVDEVHRFNKAQQDALLPWVENGTVILIGATTENPYFSVNRPLLSRSRVFQLRALNDEDLRLIAQQALSDPRGFAEFEVELAPEALEHLVNVANGDARALLNALELAVETTEADTSGRRTITLEVAEESIQRRAVLYDKEGDYHFDTISAFIKSLRGSDPDATVYWLARMVYAGEDPHFIFRRMLIFASEDVGLADPDAVRVIVAAAECFDRIGLPEGRFPLAQAALYLATAPKSNSVFAFFDALEAVEREREAEVPTHLKDASRDGDGLGHGANYLYPHAYREHWVAQQYLPDTLQGRVFYTPSDSGRESALGTGVRRRRELQLAAMMDAPAPLPEVLTFSPQQKERDQWLQRAGGDLSAHLEQNRDRVFQALRLQRHCLVLDLNAASGFLTWEALRQVPEGGVWSVAADKISATSVKELASFLPQIEQPVVLLGPLQELDRLVREQDDGLRFDAVIGRNALGGIADKAAAIGALFRVLADGAQISLVETVTFHSQRLYKLVDTAALGDQTTTALIKAEETIYQDPDNHAVNWRVEELRDLFETAGFDRVRVKTDTKESIRRITNQQLTHWFSPGGEKQKTFATFLHRSLSQEEVDEVRKLFERQLNNKSVAWSTTQVYLTAHV